jgi:uncharacterized protein YdhG (YjbR/CyaY superfamily)
MRSVAAKPATIDDYLSRLPDAQRDALQRLRTQIRAAAPDADETISYQIPSFKLNGMLVGFGATKKHCAMYTMSTSLVARFATELSAFDTSTGTIRFTPDAPLPAPLVKKLVKARIAENAALD